MVTNWPEITRFCMCCSLNVGIYITAGYHSLILIGIASYEGWQINEHVRQNDTPWCNMTATPLHYRDQLIQQAVTHHVSRIILKMVMLVSTITLVWGMFSDKPKLINLYLKINIPVWVVNTCDLALTVPFMNMVLKLILVFQALIYAYQLVAVRSKYRSMIGKSMIYRESGLSLDRFYQNTSPNDTSTSNATPITRHTNTLNDTTVNDNTNDNFDTAPSYNFARSERCNGGPNNDEDRRIDTPAASTPIDGNPPLYEEVPPMVEPPKEFNLKDEEPVIFDPSQLVARRHPLLVDSGVDSGESSMGTPRRPSSLALSNDEKKKAMEDSPVIYDQDQLNVGRSPVIEDRDETN